MYKTGDDQKLEAMQTFRDGSNADCEKIWRSLPGDWKKTTDLGVDIEKRRGKGVDAAQ